jgi:hypothetical protein
LREIERYTIVADQRKLSVDAMAKIENDDDGTNEQ